MTTEGGSANGSRRDSPRYQRLMAATRAAARQGYDAVSMRDLAETCRLSMTTIYHFCRSKDQLIAEAHADVMLGFRERLATRPPKGATPEERVRRVFDAMIAPLDDDATLTRTLLRAIYSLDPQVGSARASVGDAYTSVIDAALGDAPIADRDAIIATLSLVLDSVIRCWLSGRYDTAWARTRLHDAVHTIVAPRL